MAPNAFYSFVPTRELYASFNKVFELTIFDFSVTIKTRPKSLNVGFDIMFRASYTPVEFYLQCNLILLFHVYVTIRPKSLQLGFHFGRDSHNGTCAGQM